MATPDDTTSVPQLAFSFTEPEIWRPVVGYEGKYEVSNLGRVRSLDRLVPRQGFAGPFRMRGRMLKPYLNQLGYPMVQITRGIPTFVHLLVLEAFVAPRKSGLVCNHLDANPRNNRVENLEWTTQTGNMQHAARLGLIRIYRGQENSNAKVTEEQVRTIRRLSKEGHSQRALAASFGIGRATVRSIIDRKNWKHVPED